MAKITLPTLSVKYLVDLLGQTGWSRNAQDVYLAGMLLCDVLPTFVDAQTAAVPDFVPDPRELVAPAGVRPPLRMPNGEVQQDEAIRVRDDNAKYNRIFALWARKTIEIDLTDKQTALCRFLTEHFAGKAALQPNEYTYKLLTIFGYSA